MAAPLSFLEKEIIFLGNKTRVLCVDGHYFLLEGMAAVIAGQEDMQIGSTSFQRTGSSRALSEASPGNHAYGSADAWRRIAAELSNHVIKARSQCYEKWPR